MIDDICKKFAIKVQEIRVRKGISKADVSSSSDLDYSYIGKIERLERYPNLKTIVKLANGLDVPIKDLFDF